MSAPVQSSAAADESPTALAERLNGTAARYLACLLNVSLKTAWRSPVTFQLFTDGEKHGPDKLAQWRHESLSTIGKHLDQMNRKGAGVFVGVNQDDGRGRSRENITAIRGLHVDIDAKESVEPFDIPTILAALPLPPTMVVRTPGGLHIYWLFPAFERCDDPAQRQAHEADLKAVAKHLKPHGADSKAAQVQTVLRVPGFDHRKLDPCRVELMRVDGPRYTRAQVMEAFGLDPAPHSEASPRAKDVDTTPAEGIDPERAMQRGQFWLENFAPIAIEGEAGDVTTFKVAAQLKDYGCSQDQALQIMSGWWNEQCTPPWEPEELATKVRNAFRHGNTQQGALAPEAVFPEAEAQEAEKLHPLEALNKDHAFVLVGGAGFVLWDTRDEHGKPAVKLLNLPTFHQLHAAKVLQTGKRAEPLTQAWMTWAKRRTFEKICLAPGETLPPQFYNLWKGFSVEPKPGNWSKMRTHIRDVICSGSPALDRYVMGWLALSIQKPGTRAEVALVLRGGKGVGKGMLGNCLCRMFGRHAVHLANAKHLVGNFNGHFREAVFVFADEAFWAGDRQHESTLKAIVTEPHLMLEAKGKDAEMWPNRLHLLMASNDEWVIPASGDERRFCVVDVSSARRGDWRYFKELADQMERGGLEAMLYDLQRCDLSTFEVRSIPSTDALQDQKWSSLRGPERWLGEALRNAAIYGVEWTDVEEPLVSKEGVYANYQTQARNHYGEKYPADMRLFWRKLIAILKSGGLELEDVRKRSGPDREKKVRFPTLTRTREAFSIFLGGPVLWDGSPEVQEIDRPGEVDIFS